MTRILIPTDFSGNALAATDAAISLFGAEADYTMLHLYHEPYAAATSMISLVDIAMQDSRRSLKEELERIHTKFGKDLRISGLSEYGDGGRQIASLAARMNIDLIVMGTKGASGLKEVLVGSVAAATINSSSRPVLIIPEGVVVNRDSFKTWVVAVDDLRNTEILTPVRAIAKLFSASLRFLRIIQGEKGHTNGHDTRPAYLLGDEGYTELAAEEPVSGIAEFLRRNTTDVLVMFPGNHGFMDRIFKRSNTGKMAMHAGLPLLTVHK
jgi:nucleotide-binding universal stress UspA family protein